LVTVDGYPYKGRYFDLLSNVEKVVRNIPTLEKVIVVSYVKEKPDISSVPKSILYNELISLREKPKICFEHFPSDNPLPVYAGKLQAPALSMKVKSIRR
jgi:acetoacetyl-CoA synthetase